MMVFGAFDYVEKMALPQDLLKWNGKLVRASGFMNAKLQTKGFREFELVKDRGSCCFGARPKMNHFFQVKLKGDAKVDYTSELVTVVGTLTIDERWDGDWMLGLYWLDDGVVIQ